MEFFVGIILLAARWWNLGKIMNFSMDQGMFMLRAREIWMSRELTLLGPAASPVWEGKHFFQGPATYYLLGLLGWIGSWDPVKTTMAFAALSLIGVVGMYLVFRKISPKMATFGAIVYGLWPVTIKYSQFLWNPNFLLIILPWGIWTFMEEKYVWSGLIMGMSGQFHYQVALMLVLMGGYLLLGKKFRAAGKFLAGVVIGYSPLIIFELRNNFYNIKIIWGWLTHGTGNNDFLTEHYFLWLYLIIFTLIYYLVERKFKKITVGLVTVVVLAWILAVVAEKKITGNWIAVDYPTINKISGMITSGGCPKNFEVASTAEGDSRFYSLRYLLTEKGCPPMGVEDYPKTERLFLLAAADRPVEKETIWEVTSMGEIEVVKEEKVGNNFVFYELQKAVH